MIRTDLAAAAVFADRPPHILNMSGNLPPKVPHVFDGAYRDAVAAVLAQKPANDLVGAHQFRGAEHDRLAGRDFVARRLPQAPDADRIIVTNGTQSALTMLIAGLVGRGGLLAIEELSYPTMKQFADMFGIGLCAIPMDGEGIIPDAYEAMCRAHRVSAYYAMPSLQNPTTAIMSAERRMAVAAISRRYGVAIIEDDIYSLLPTDLPPPLSSYAPEISWYILGTAKAMAAALKVAYVVAPSAEAARARFWPGVRATYWMTAPINVAVMSELVANGSAEAIIQAVRAETRARQSLVTDKLAHANPRALPEGLQVWLTLPTDRPREQFAGGVLARGIEISTSDTYFFGTTTAPNAIRFGTGTAPDRAAFERGLDAIVEVYGR